MFTRRRRQPEPGVPVGDIPDGVSTIAGGDESVMGGMSFMGDGVSLDGQSVLLPGDPGYIAPGADDPETPSTTDDVSSINSSIYGGGAFFGAEGKADNGEDSVMDASRAAMKGDSGKGVSGVPSNPEEPKGAADGEEGDKKKGAAAGICCLPPWVTSAPTWLKAVIVIAVALLVGAIVLLGVAAGLDGQSNPDAVGGNDDRFQPTVSPVDPDPLDPTPAPTLTKTLAPVTNPPTGQPVPGQTPVPTTLPSFAPSAQPTTPGPSAAPSLGPTMSPSMMPTARQTSPPSGLPVTPLPTPPPADGRTVFYLNGGRPLGQHLVDYTNNLAQLPKETDDSFFVNLGDWGSPRDYNCSESSYNEVSILYSDSSVPVYFVPGDNEYNDCEVIGPETALEFWYEYLLRYDRKHWGEPPYEVRRQAEPYEENFAFVSKQVLYVGLNLVGGLKLDDVWDSRLLADLEWVQENFDRYEDDIIQMVVFSHSDPRLTNNAMFFNEFENRVRDVYAPKGVILCHRNLQNRPANMEIQYNGVENYAVLTVYGSIWPPMRIEIDAMNGVLSWNQGDWWDRLNN
uniref:Calcineurin-like phosphoesterase domain-containing protein n=2 Tax=Grammatophora oceanica TaxID=210454 RepID=A0A7S1YN44_9STRA|mmetsp:Transcript_7486/g.10971  ORF Transcript_7486/g.10971 Transcript_7486/m.10971 type:complete len:567 (+) Transcript_7486:188-1888(+)|eukprot:CAMPEP_0194033904 /NCGR_PEP_ID=MMETSP0009_2-20130614/6387_1 /TAXON_ID=210454 /ORGANISM="Grammatophora oceanica, Strain CCMP 410" /LENGTH=566 /DNA_ID=CAMNT_0038674635 /DNA_START=188 /DNA_END=1888 /DNA_ORIENTATION=+